MTSNRPTRGFAQKGRVGEDRFRTSSVTVGVVSAPGLDLDVETRLRCRNLRNDQQERYFVLKAAMSCFVFDFVSDL
jgi:hypothetical protein